MDASTRDAWVGGRMGWKDRKVDGGMEGQGGSGWMKDGREDGCAGVEGRRKGWLGSWKAGREDGRRKRGRQGGCWRETGQRRAPGSGGAGRAGAGAVRSSGRGGPPVPGRYMLSSSGTAPAPCLMAAVGAARGLHVLIFLPLLLLLLFHFIREQLMANKWQRDGQGTGRGRGRRGRRGGSFQATRRGSGPRLQQFPPL